MIFLLQKTHFDCIPQVYALEKVLKLKRDPITQVIFLDEAMKVISEFLSGSECELTYLQALENKPSSIFWSALGRSLEKQSHDTTKGGFVFIRQCSRHQYTFQLRLSCSRL